MNGQVKDSPFSLSYSRDEMIKAGKRWSHSGQVSFWTFWKVENAPKFKNEVIMALRDPGPALGRWSGGHMQDRLGREETEA